MSPQEFWLIAKAKQPEEKIGNLPAEEFHSLKAMLEK